MIQQSFIEGGQANLSDIRDLLTFNDFKNIKRQDYYNDEFGLLLEDMHDENVIAKDDALFFIEQYRIIWDGRIIASILKYLKRN